MVGSEPPERPMGHHHHGVRSGGDSTLESRSRSTGEILRRVSVYLKPYRGMALGTVGCAVLSLGCGFAYPRLTQFIVDEVIRGKRADLLTPAILGLLGAFALREVFNSLRIRINNAFEQSVIYDMRRDVYAHLQRLPVSFFDQRASGDLMTRVIEDVNSVERVLIDGTEQGSVAVLSILGALGFMTWTSPSLTLLALVPLPFLVAGALWYTLTAHERYRDQRKASSAMNALLMDNLQGVRQIKAFGQQAHEDTRFAERADGLRRGTLTIMRAWATYSPAMALATSVGIALVLWRGGVLVMDGRLGVGQLVAFVILLNFFYEPVARLHGLNQMLQAARAAGERVFDILDHPVERTDRTGNLPFRVRGEVRYESVEFAYGPDRAVLRGISLEAGPGTMTAVVGPTGAGKSTLLHLMPAFYECTSGRILIDGQDIRGIRLESLRQQIAVVSQEAFLFNDTLRANILYGKLDSTEEEMVAAARAANAHEFIERLPDGYNSRVGERGVKLSVGEKQRVSVARALLKDAPILILDEATASVDTQTERLIQEALERLMRGRTTFVIAHRLSTIRNADQILVMRQGRVVEKGTHESLLRLEGLYARLARIQNTSTIEEGFERLAESGS